MADKPGPLHVVGVGASAGGVEALKSFTAGLPTSLPCAVLVVLHMPARAPSVLARILDRYGALPAITATAGMRPEPGRVYVAAPDHHLLVDDDRLVLAAGPTENGHRPAINALFRSIALGYGQRGTGVLLSGVLDDGVLGLAAIRPAAGWRSPSRRTTRCSRRCRRMRSTPAWSSTERRRRRSVLCWGSWPTEHPRNPG